MNPQVKQLMQIAKETVSKETYKKVRFIEDEKELQEALQYSIISSLEQKHHKLNKEIQRLEKQSKNLLIAKSKSLLVPSKIKHFAVEFNKDEFYKLSRLLNDIEKEMKNGLV
ncbi:MAG: hypothetical protein ABIH92_05910 [Nanoarchaeota archaeon]